MEWILSTKKKMSSVLINGELTIGSLYAQVKMASSGSELVFEDPNGMAQVRKRGNRHFEHDSVTYRNDVKTTGGLVFSLAQLFNPNSALLLAIKSCNYLSGQIEFSVKRGRE